MDRAISEEDHPSRHSVHAVLRRVHRESNGHAHSYFQVAWGFEGLVELEVEGVGVRLTPGQVLVIAPGQWHEYRAPRDARCFVVDSKDGTHWDRLESLAGRVRSADPSVGYLMRYLAAQPMASAAAAELLLASLSYSGELTVPRARRPIDWPALEAWIDVNLSATLDVPTLAARAHLSPTQFAARCVEELGVAPMAVVRGRRLAAALRLRDSGMPVATIALRCGYRSPSALTAALKRESSAR